MKNGKKSTFNSENKKKKKKYKHTHTHHITSPRQAITKENGKINLE